MRLRSNRESGGGSDGLKWRYPADLVHLFVLSCFAIAQPLLDLLAQYPTFFVAHKTEPEDIVTLGLALVLVPPLVPLVLEVATGWLLPRWRRAVHGAAVLVLMTLIALPPAIRLPFAGGWGGLVLALLVAAGFTFAYLRYAPLRLFTTILTPILVLAPALFFFNGAVWDLVAKPEAKLSKHLTADRKGVTIAKPVPIFLLLLDEFPVTSLMDGMGQIDAGRYPNFAALARVSTWYRNATTVSDATHVSVPSILTGRYPHPSDKPGKNPVAPTYENYRRNLFALLSGTYTIRSLESTTLLCPRGVCERPIPSQPFLDRMRGLIQDGYAVYLNIITPPALGRSVPGVGGMWGGFWEDGDGAPRKGKAWKRALVRRRKHTLKQKFGDNRVYRFREFVDAVEVRDRPLFHFLHVLLPHQPWVLAPQGWRNSKRGQRPPGQLAKVSKWKKNQFLADQALERHLLQVGCVDALLGELIDKLKETGLFDNALVVVTADHGASFQPGADRRKVTRQNFHEIMPVPLFFKLPQQTQGKIDDRNVQTIDIVPSIFQVIGLKGKPKTDGISFLADPPRERPMKRIFLGTRRKRARDPATIEVPANALEKKYETAQRNARVFGTGSWDALYRYGPKPNLVGQAVGGLSLDGTAENIAISIDHPEELDVDSDSAFRPEHITGAIVRKDGAKGILELGIAVNGVIRSTVESYRNKRHDRFTAIVPGDVFQEGRNKVDVFVIREEPNGNLVLQTVRP